MPIIDVERNERLRAYVRTLAEEYGVSSRFLAKKMGVHYNMFMLWKNESKNFMDCNLDKIEEVLRDMYAGLLWNIKKLVG